MTRRPAIPGCQVFFSRNIPRGRYSAARYALTLPARNRGGVLEGLNQPGADADAGQTRADDEARRHATIEVRAGCGTRTTRGREARGCTNRVREARREARRGEGGQRDEAGRCRRAGHRCAMWVRPSHTPRHIVQWLYGSIDPGHRLDHRNGYNL